MRKTIGFFGDSFCAGREPDSWCVLLAKKLNANVVHWGEPGKSIWSTFINFNNFRLNNDLPSFIIFCYTEPFRLYHPKIILSANTQALPVQQLENPCQNSGVSELAAEDFVPVRAVDLLGREIDVTIKNQLIILVDKQGRTKKQVVLYE